MANSNRHIELYKRYRPRKWSGIIGQDKVVSALKGAVAAGKVPTAYAFLGDRGCGKTSAAFVLAKAVNCLNPSNGEPCNKCEICKNIDNGTQIGVNYISMANKGSVDDIREITQQARLATGINRQVWILDEVHTISKVAFDALLIPLEDEKMPSLFILCSTEVNKIPQTILSRVQQRKFSLVSEDVMRKYISRVVEHEKLTEEVTDEDIAAVVRQGRGSVRDTLTSLESFVEGGDLGGFANYGGRLLEAFSSGNLAETLSVIAEATGEGSVDGRELAEQLFGDLRDLLLASTGADESLYPGMPIEDPTGAAKSMLGVRGIAIAIDEVGDSLTRMSVGADHRVHLEIAIVRALQKLKQLKAQLAKRAA